MRPSILIISTVPPVPRDYGNRNRVYQTWNFFNSLGYEVYFLLYPFDSDWSKSIPSYYKDLRILFDYFDVVANSQTLHLQAQGFHHDIDEWWDDNIGVEIEFLTARKKFDIVFVNYTFLAKAFTFFDSSTLKILDTHDLFGGRREIFEANGVPPEFFYTSTEEECVGFDRADIVIGIKSSEAQIISEMTKSTVVCIPYYDSRFDYLDQSIDESKVRTKKNKLIIGFIGAKNSVNTVNMQVFIDTIEANSLFDNRDMEFHIAGNVCGSLNVRKPFIKLLGHVKIIDDFYQSIDLIVAPLAFSTGIKIKVGEALSYGIPIISTSNAYDGFSSSHPLHHMASIPELCDALIDIVDNKVDLDELREAGIRSCVETKNEVAAGFNKIRTIIKSRLSRIYVFSSRSFWFRECFVDEMISQSIEYFSHIGQVVVISSSKDHFLNSNIHASIEFIALSDADKYTEAAQIFDTYRPRAIISFDQNFAAEMKQISSTFQCGCWQFSVEDSLAQNMTGFTNLKNLQFTAVSPLRYLPTKLNKQRQLPVTHGVKVCYLSNDENINSESLKGFFQELNRTGIESGDDIKMLEYDEYNPDAFKRVMNISSFSHAIIIGANDIASVFLRRILVIMMRGYTLISKKETVIEQIDEKGLLSRYSVVQSENEALEILNGNAGWDVLWAGIAAEQ